MKRQLVDQYPGRWVAVNADGDVVADAREVDELLTSCRDKRFGAEVVVHRVPEADAPLFVGLG